MTKSQQYFQDMMEYHKELFEKFKAVHDVYSSASSLQAKHLQKEFNEIGEEVMTVIRKYENMLCSQAEGGKYGKFSNKTAETFWKYIRSSFPKIDFIGMK